MDSLANKLRNIKREQLYYFFAVCVLNIVFFFLVGDKGFLLEKDSTTYIKWSYISMRRGYTLYPWFLKLVRLLHGENSFLSMVPLYQGLLSIICNVILVGYLRNRYKIGNVYGFLMHLFVLAPYTYTLPDAVSSHYVLTEGLSIPLFHISMFFFLKGILDKKYKSLLISILSGVFLFLLRPQLAIIPAIYMALIVLCIFYDWARNNNKSFFWPAVAVVFMTVFIVGLYAYFAIIEGWSGSSENSQLIEATTGKALCLLKEEDSNLYSDTDKAVYLTLYNDCDENGRLVDDFPPSLMEYEQLHKIINGNVSLHETIIWNYFFDVRGDDGGLEAYAVRNLITSTEISNHKIEYIGIIMRLMPSSLVASVFVQPSRVRFYCYMFAGILYGIACFMIYYSIRKRIDTAYVFPVVTVGIIIFVNALACNVLLYGQQRYVIYCMGLFYISLLLAVEGCYKVKQSR